MADDLRRQILIDIQQNGVGALSALEQAIVQTKAGMTALTAAFHAGEASGQEFRAGISKGAGDIKFFLEQLKALDPEAQRLQEALRAMGERAEEAGAGL